MTATFKIISKGFPQTPQQDKRTYPPFSSPSPAPHYAGIMNYNAKPEAGGAGQSFVRAFESCCHSFVGRHNIKTPPQAELSTSPNKRLSCPPYARLEFVITGPCNHLLDFFQKYCYIYSRI
jgi:hypothetical protein